MEFFTATGKLIFVVVVVVDNQRCSMWRVWQELEYRIDVCRVTHGAHIEHLQMSKKSVFLWLCKISIKVGPLVFLL